MTRRTSSAGRAGALALALLAASGPAEAQMHHPHMPADSARVHAAPPDTEAHHSMEHGMHMAGMDRSEAHAHMHMSGMYGPYSVTREASGTAWQPDAAEHVGIHVTRGEWMLMLHGSADVVVDRQGGPRGEDKAFSDNMVMGRAQRSLGPGELGVRTMLSAEPATIGKRGYPLLLQSGETADGRTPLIDRQHPHDLFMELAGTYSVSTGNRSLYLYAGLPGEPALGPPAFMHRFSGMHIPQAPITHHWLDSSHISYGVLTAGVVVGRVKLEASAFRGREPDQNRWDIESPKLDSRSFRLSVNPTSAWALQVSHGRLESPEQLEPEVDQDRTTASAIYDGHWSRGRWEGTLAWGRDRNRPGHTLDAFTAEAGLRVGERHTFLARAETVQKDELFPASDPRAGTVFHVGQLSAGYRCDFWRGSHVATGIGALGSLSLVPSELEGAYGRRPASALLFAHAELR